MKNKEVTEYSEDHKDLLEGFQKLQKNWNPKKKQRRKQMKLVFDSIRHLFE